LEAFALLVRLDVESNTLSFSQVLQSGALDSGDVNKHIAAAAVGFDEAIATLSIEELDRTSHGHRETPPPYWTNIIESGRPILLVLPLRWIGFFKLKIVVRSRQISARIAPGRGV